MNNGPGLPDCLPRGRDLFTVGRPMTNTNIETEESQFSKKTGAGLGGRDRLSVIRPRIIEALSLRLIIEARTFTTLPSAEGQLKSRSGRFLSVVAVRKYSREKVLDIFSLFFGPS